LLPLTAPTELDLAAARSDGLALPGSREGNDPDRRDIPAVDDEAEANMLEEEPATEENDDAVYP